MGKLFISYRRADSDFVHRLAEKLENRIDGMVFIDRNIEKEDFVEALETEIHSCNVFLLAVTDNTFDASRIHQEDDWIRREIRLALSLKKPICLVLREYKTPPPPHELPEEIANIVTKQGVPIHLSYFDEGADNIAQHCVNISEGALKLKSKSPDEKVSTFSQSGENNIQQNVQSANNSTIIGQQVNSDNRRRDTLAKIETLRKDREEEVRKLNRLNNNSESPPTAQSYVFQFGGFIFLALIAYLIHPLGAVLAIGLGFAFILFQGTENNKKFEEYQNKKQLLRKNISMIDAEITKQKELQERLENE